MTRRSRSPGGDEVPTNPSLKMPTNGSNLSPTSRSSGGCRLKPDDLFRQFATAMPTLIHGDVPLYELEAILRYIDEAFPGPALRPANVPLRAQMTQLMAIMRDQLHACAIVEIVGLLLFQPLIGRSGEAGDLAGAEHRLTAILSLIVDFSAVITSRPGQEWLLGPTPILADLQLAPIVHLRRQTDIGRRALAESEPLEAWWSRVQERAWLKEVLLSAEIG